MKTASRALVLAAVVPAMLGSGCYTVLKGPRVASDFTGEPRYAGYDSYDSASDRDDLLAPNVGSSSDRDDDPYEDFYGGAPYGGTYGGYGGYGGYGAPVFGYDSRRGLFGNYGYGGYYPGAGPVGYGYDPYYSGAYGTYVPPGYQLVTTTELDQLRADAIRQNTTHVPTYEPPDPAVLLQQQQEQARTDREVWQQRQESRQRSAPVLTPRPPATVTKSTSSQTSSSSTSSSSSSSSEEEKKSAKPKKRGR